jgi:single-strand DNA-binding protein
VNDSMTITGLVSTTPRHIITADATAITSFRLASRFTHARTGEDHTNWYTVTAFGPLATHVAASLEKDQRVIVVGSVIMREWETGERSGISFEIEATSIGHDLSFGRAVFTPNRTARQPEAKPE